MSTTAKRNVAKLLTGCMLVSALSGVGTLPAQAAELEGSRSMVTHVSGDTTKYYYNDLVEKGCDLAVKFYDVLEEMNANGDFLDGVIQYDMGSIVSSGELKQWVEYGDLTIPKAFGAARDSFLLDHPELFYIDIYKIMLSAGRTGGTYKGYIDSGRDDTIYRDGAFETEEEVEAAIQKYESAVKRAADAVRTAAEVDGAYNILYKDDCILAMAANDQLANVKYDFDSYYAHTEDDEEAVEDMLSHTAYGALVNSKAACSGFSAAYKAVMDELGIPCVIVSGYSRGRDASGNYTDGDIGHAWNYVQLETKARDAVLKDDGSVDTQADEVAYEWFAFDPTWNSVAADKSRYSVMDKATEGREHYTIAAISSSGYEMNYPQISSLNYAKAIGADANDEDTTDEKFAYRRETKPSGSSLQVLEYVSYDGMNATQLTEETGMRIATRYYYAKQDGSKEWSQWQDLTNFVALDEVGFGILNDGDETVAFVANNMITTQFVVVDGITPDVDMPDWKIFGGWYSDSDAVQAAAVFMSKE